MANENIRQIIKRIKARRRKLRTGTVSRTSNEARRIAARTASEAASKEAARRGRSGFNKISSVKRRRITIIIPDIKRLTPAELADIDFTRGGFGDIRKKVAAKLALRQLTAKARAKILKAKTDVVTITDRFGNIRIIKGETASPRQKAESIVRRQKKIDARIAAQSVFKDISVITKRQEQAIIGRDIRGIRRQLKKLPTGSIQAKRQEAILRQLQREAGGVKALEQRQAKAVKRTEEIFRAVPLLRGDSFAQETIRKVLAAPSRITVTVFGDAAIAGFKAQLLLKAFQNQATKKAAIQEARRAGVATPEVLINSFDPRTPAGLANIITLVALPKVISSKAGVRVTIPRPSAIKTRIASTARSIGRTSPKAVRTLTRIARDPASLKKVFTSAKKAAVRIKQRAGAGRAKRATRKRLAEGKLQRIQSNEIRLAGDKLRLKKAVASLRTFGRVPKKAQFAKTLKGQIFRETKLEILRTRKSIKSGKAANVKLKAEFKKLGFSKRSIRAGRVRQSKKDILKEKARQRRLEKERTKLRKLLKKAKRSKKPPLGPAQVKAIKQLQKAQRQAVIIKKQIAPRSPLELRALALANFRKANQVANQVKKLTGQTTNRAISNSKIKSINKKINKISQSSSKKVIQATKKSVDREIKTANGQVLLLRPPKVKTVSAQKIMNVAQKASNKFQLNVLSSLSVAVAVATRQSLRLPSRVIPKAALKQPTKASVIQARKQAAVQKQQTITIPKIAAITTTTQLILIDQLLRLLQGTQFIIKGGRRIPAGATRLRMGPRKLRAFLRRKIKGKKRVFTPDLYSIIFGIKARAGEKIKLLKAGRTFTGLERRKLVK